MRKICVAFLGHVAPYTPEFYEQPGYGRPGSLAELGFIEAIHASSVGLDKAWGFRPISHYPKVKIKYEGTRVCELPCGAKLTLLPLINFFFIREISRYFIIAFVLIKWALLRLGRERILVMYNLTHPNGVCWVRLMTWLTHTKLVPVIYDLAQIPEYTKGLIFRMLEPDWLDRVHEKLIPLCDGLMPITNAIQEDFAPNLKFLRVDGGVGEVVLSSIKPSAQIADPKDKTFKLFYAGSMDPWNQITLLLDFMAVTPDPDLRLWMAGRGKDDDKVKAAAEKDSRIVFWGFVGPEKLQALYDQADVLVSLRNPNAPGLKYHYPSKTFEMMAMGKPLILANASHTAEVYGKWCKVLKDCTVETLSQAVETFKAMSPTERRAYGERTRQYLLENRRWKAWGGPIGAYLEGLVKG